jgi:hypothetical protein
MSNKRDMQIISTGSGVHLFKYIDQAWAREIQGAMKRVNRRLRFIKFILFAIAIIIILSMCYLSSIPR